MGRIEQTEYLMVVQAPCYRIDACTFATEGAFAEHLKLLQKKLSPRFKKLRIAAPHYTYEYYDRNKSHLGLLRQEDNIEYIPLNSAQASAVQFWTREVGAVWRTLREAIERASVVHSGLAWDIKRPVPLFATGIAIFAQSRTIFVVDIDFRRDAWRLWKTGKWSLKSFIVSKLLYNPLRLAHLRLATRTASLCLLKGASLVRDFGRNRDNVRNFWDAAHSFDRIIGPEMLQSRLHRLADPSRPISLIYFGRFVEYKGLDRMIKAVWKARRASKRPFVLNMIGAGDELERLHSLIEELGAKDAVRFSDPLPYGAILFSKIYGADLLLATPLSEDTPRSAFDAMACGMPILAFDIEYYLSLAAESGAVQTSPWPDVDAFAENIVSLDSKRERLMDMSEAAVKFASVNTQEIWIDRRVNWTFSLLDNAAARR